MFSSDAIVCFFVWALGYFWLYVPYFFLFPPLAELYRLIHFYGSFSVPPSFCFLFPSALDNSGLIFFFTAIGSLPLSVNKLFFFFLLFTDLPP